MKSHDVKVWSIKVNVYAATNGRPQRKSYTVRWIVAGQEKSKTFGTRPLADNYRSDLKQATNKGEAFDVETGLPESMTPTVVGPTWFEHVEKYVAMKWPDAAANTRKSMLEALVAVTPVLVAKVKDEPSGEVLRKALRNHLVPDDRVSCDVEQLAALDWLRSASLELTALEDSDVVRSALDAVAKKLDGTAAAATTRRRKRAVFFNVLEFGIELNLLTHNPIDRLRVRKRQTKVVETVDRRVVANPGQARELLVALTYVGGRDRYRGWKLRACFGAMYFVGLREPDCHLPARCPDCKADLTHDYANTPVNGCAHERLACGWDRYTLRRTGRRRESCGRTRGKTTMTGA